MDKLFRRLAIALVGFILGVSITSIYRLARMPDAVLPEVTKIHRQWSCFPGLSLKVLKSSEHKGFFFPASLSENFRSAEFRNEWYSRHLEAMNELPLAALVDEEESYRFLWLRSFHHPVAVRVWRTGARYFIVAKQLSGRGGYEPGPGDLYWARPLSENDWDAFMMDLEHSSYWLMPTEDQRIMTDGAQWVLEGYREGRYHVVDRQSPEANAYHDACLLLLRQSGLLSEIPAHDVY